MLGLRLLRVGADSLPWAQVPVTSINPDSILPGGVRGPGQSRRGVS